LSAANDLTGLTYGRLVVIERAASDARGNARWVCQCKCKKITTVRGSSLKSGTTTSCGCARQRKPEGATRAASTKKADREFEKSLALAQQHGAWRRELTGQDILHGEPRATFGDQEAVQATAQHQAERVAPKGPMHERWGFDPGPGVRPTRKERGLK